MGLKSVLKQSKWIRRCYEKTSSIKFKFMTLISPTWNTKARYKAGFGKKLDLSNPITLNEKVLWLKLNRYMKHPLVIQCADKYRVREYVESCGCADILNELYGVYEKPEDIPWDDLPNEFVLKWNFGAGMNIICLDKSKMDRTEVVCQLKKWGRRKVWLTHSEMQYKYAPKRIVCEQLIR